MRVRQQNECPGDSRPAYILHLEDREQDRELVREMIQGAGIQCAVTAVETRHDFLNQVAGKDWDLILSDYALPAFDGLTALEIATRKCPDTPFIFVTGTLGEDTAVESLKRGATDYVLKQGMKRLSGSVRRALNERAEKKRREKVEVELDRSEERLRFLACHDALTCLPNRTLFEDRLAQILSDAGRRGEHVALVFIDLDRFKDVNEWLGHTAGDIVLKESAARLRKCARNSDTVARLGGDEFVIVLGGISDSTDAVMAADRIKQEFANEFAVNGTSITTTCSMGISIFPADGSDPETLLKHADIALFSAKEGGRNGWRFFTQEMNAQARQRLSMEAAMRQAIQKEQFFLEYQPQMEIATGRIVGAEALLRWRHPEMGLIPPSTFIPVAENNGEILVIGEWVLRTACTQARLWQKEGMPPVVVAVNVSGVQLRQGCLPTTIKRLLEETGLAPQHLALEITESVLLPGDDQIAAQMLKLKEMGLSLALDDFGTGYSSFAYMRRFRFDKLKVDGSFVKALTTSQTDAQITSAIIGMGKILDMKVIAECVETGDELDFLRTHGCDEMQGYYFSRPLGTCEFAEINQSVGSSLLLT